MAGIKDLEAAQRRRYGAALKALRRRLGLTQEAVAASMEITTQAYQNYEAGKRHFSDPKLTKILIAMNSDREEFDLQLALIPEVSAGSGQHLAGVEERSFGNVYELPLGGIAHGGPQRPAVYDDGERATVDLSRFFAPGTEVLQLGGMSMWPYAAPGGFITFNRRDLAKRGEGCVVEMSDGSKLVKRYEFHDAENLTVTELWPEERQLTIPLADVAGVYAIGLRAG